MKGLVHASTSLLRSHAQFTQLVDALPSSCKDRLLLFALSRDAPDLEQSVKQLCSFAGESIGCLSGPLPIQSRQSFFSCSVGIFERDSCVPFSSLVTGEAPIQVGRWHSHERVQASRKTDSLDRLDFHERVNWNEIWKSKGSERFFPRDLKNVRDIRTVVYFSDKSSTGLASAIHENWPEVYQLGMSAASTPFSTGHPITLLRNGKVQSSGAVGIALSTAPYEDVLDFDGVVRLTRPLTVRRSEGNLIHELEGALPARILLKAIQGHEISDKLAKDVDYYIGVRDSDVGEGDRDTPRLVKIVAGSPSRGSIAVEEVPAPPIGSSIEFFYRLRTLPVHLQAEKLHHPKTGLLIGAVVDTPENNTPDFPSTMNLENLESGSLRSFDSSFFTSSEYGFILGTSFAGKRVSPWKCTVPSAFGGFKFL